MFKVGIWHSFVCIFLFTSLTTAKVVTVSDIDQIWREISRLADQHGRVTDLMQTKIYQIEKELGSNFDTLAQKRFQTMVATFGAKMRGPILPPENHTGYFLLESSPLDNFQTAKEIIPEVDILVIGMGLAGTSAIYELSSKARNLKIAAVDFGNPASQASGRNGGNFQLLPESFLGNYEGIVREREKFLKKTNPHLLDDKIKDLAIFEARVIMNIGVENGKIINEIITKEKINADVSREGWLRVAVDKNEEAALINEVRFANSVGIKMQILSPKEIKDRFGINTNFSGRFAPEFGNYHPRKFVSGVLQKAIENGVEIYTQTKVEGVDFSPSTHVNVATSRGLVKAKKVIFATNAFTAEILPQLSSIKPYVSQIFDLNHVKSNLINSKTGASITFTTNYGDLYLNFPLSTIYKDQDGFFRGMAHIGGGEDRPVDNPHKPPLSEKVFYEVLEHAYNLYPEIRGQPPVRINVGPMAFTEDRKIVLGYLEKTNQRAIVAAGFNGYGGTWAVWAGKIAAQMASQGYSLPTEIQDMFTPNRFTSKYNNCPKLL